jgi:hypothetical protein
MTTLSSTVTGVPNFHNDIVTAVNIALVTASAAFDPDARRDTSFRPHSLISNTTPQPVPPQPVLPPL